MKYIVQLTAEELLKNATSFDDFLQVFDSRSESVHVCVDDDKNEGDDEVENQPDIDHLDVSRRGEALVHLFIK